MSSEPRDELSTADMVTAGQPNGRTVTTETPGYPTGEHAEDRQPRAAAFRGAPERAAADRGRQRPAARLDQVVVRQRQAGGVSA